MIDKLLRLDMPIKEYKNWLVKSVDKDEATVVALLEQVSDKELQSNNSEQVSVIKEVRKLLFFNRLQEQERLEKLVENRRLIDEQLHNQAKEWWIS